MGILADLLSGATTIQGTGSQIANDRVTVRKLEAVIAANGDFAYPTGYAAQNEIQGIAIHTGTVSGGTFTLTFLLKSGETFTTAGIVFGANAATIQTAIDVAATAAAVVGWVNGHIAITGGPLSTTPLVITFSGASVLSKNHSQTTINGSSLTGGGGAGAASTSQHGQPNRSAWAALNVFGIVTSAPPAHGADLSAPTVGLGRGQYPFQLDGDTVKALVREAACHDANALTNSVILTALHY